LVEVKQPWLQLIVIFLLRDQRGELVYTLHVVAEILPRWIMSKLARGDILIKLGTSLINIWILKHRGVKRIFAFF
jgi:hypothetical protein